MTRLTTLRGPSGRADLSYHSGEDEFVVKYFDSAETYRLTEAYSAGEYALPAVKFLVQERLAREEDADVTSLLKELRATLPENIAAEILSVQPMPDLDFHALAQHPLWTSFCSRHLGKIDEE